MVWSGSFDIPVHQPLQMAYEKQEAPGGRQSHMLFELWFVLMGEVFKQMTTVPSPHTVNTVVCTLSSLLNVCLMAANHGASSVKLNETTTRNFGGSQVIRKVSSSKELGKTQKHKASVSTANSSPSFYIQKGKICEDVTLLLPSGSSQSWKKLLFFFFQIKIVFC